MSVQVIAVDRPELAPLEMPDRFQRDVIYFVTLNDDPQQKPLPKHEYWICREDAQRLLDEGVFDLVSPLDASKNAEVEISEEQEVWLEWMTANEVERIRIEVISR